MLDPGPSRPGLHLYAQCLRDHPGGVVLLAINTQRTESESLTLPVAADGYTLTAPKLEDARIRLNGRELTVAANVEFPTIEGKPVPAGQIALPPASIMFIAVAAARNEHC